MTKWLLLAVGGGAGSVLRYLVAGIAQRFSAGTFPIGTLVVNVSGCLLIGFFTAAFSTRFLVREEFRVAILVGVLGGYTTFSTFGLETFKLLSDNELGRAMLNVVVSCVLGILATWLGYRVAVVWFGL